VEAVGALHCECASKLVRAIALTRQIYFGISTPFSSLSLFTPSIVAGLGVRNISLVLGCNSNQCSLPISKRS